MSAISPRTVAQKRYHSRIACVGSVLVLDRFAKGSRAADSPARSFGRKDWPALQGGERSATDTSISASTSCRGR